MKKWFGVFPVTDKLTQSRLATKFSSITVNTVSVAEVK